MNKNQISKGKTSTRNSDIISSKLAAVNNKIRFSILEVLKEYEKKNSTIVPLYSREINSILLSEYGINITPQMLGQHLKQLMSAGLIMEVPTKKEVPNKIGKRNVKGYVLTENAFEDLFLEISFLSEELLSFLDLYKINQLTNSDGYCVLTVFNGADKGRTFRIHKNETAYIEAMPDDDSLSFDIISEDSSKRGLLRIFHDGESWSIIDDAGSDNTFIDNVPVKKGTAAKLKNHTFLKLYRGNSTVILYCSI